MAYKYKYVKLKADEKKDIERKIAIHQHNKKMLLLDGNLEGVKKCDKKITELKLTLALGKRTRYEVTEEEKEE